jgi:hypothetical protein
VTAEPFLEPRLIGRRFQNGEIPLEFLADFSSLSEMIVEIAKWKYREANVTRKRLPRHYFDGLTLKLTGVKSGSAIPVISLVSEERDLVPADAYGYFEDARIAFVGAIHAADTGSSITYHLPQRLLDYFDKFGRSLHDEEAIEFHLPRLSLAARLTRSTRRTLVLASSAESVSEDVMAFGSIPEMDQLAQTFQLRLLDGSKVKAPVSPHHYDTVLQAFKLFRNGQRVRVRGIGRFSRTSRLQELESIEDVSPLDPLDVGARIEELKLLKHGWLDGKGAAPTPDGLRWLAEAFDRNYSDDLRLPYLFATPEGNVLAEWSLKPWAPSLEVNIAERTAEWHALRLDSDEEETKSLSLDDAAAWRWLAERLRSLGGVSE